MLMKSQILIVLARQSKCSNATKNCCTNWRPLPDGGEAPEPKRELSRRERLQLLPLILMYSEELEKQEAQKRFEKLHLEGKTDQAKAGMPPFLKCVLFVDMARLEEIKKKREQAAAARKAQEGLCCMF